MFKATNEEEAQHYIHLFVTFCFWIDLVLNFFFSYEDKFGAEVLDHKKVVRRYFCGFFAFDLLACIPEDLVNAIFSAANMEPQNINQVARLARMQRVVAVTRVLRLVRTVKCLSVLHNAKLWRFLQRWKGTRLIGLFIVLVWMNHIFACGWYFCAAVHDDPCTTWLASRADAKGDPIIAADAFTQYFNAMYFIFTVFTTVGFGDMSASTNGEILYVNIVMLCGAVINSIIFSEVINAVTDRNAAAKFEEDKVSMVEAFGEATQLEAAELQHLKEYVRSRTRFWVKESYDKSEMEDLIQGKALSPDLINALPGALAGGQLIQNKFVTPRSDLRAPRLPIMVALHSQQTFFKAKDVVYEATEYPAHLYLVMDGVFSYIACPPKTSGKSNGEPEGAKKVSAKRFPFQLFPGGTYFGDIEMILNQPRATSARCEREGTVFALGKVDYKRICHQFPDYAKAWKTAALRRVNMRDVKQQQMVPSKNTEELATLALQKFARRLITLRRAMKKGELPKLRTGDLGGALGKEAGQTEQTKKQKDARAMQEKVLELERNIKKALGYFTGVVDVSV